MIKMEKSATINFKFEIDYMYARRKIKMVSNFYFILVKNPLKGITVIQQRHKKMKD